MLERLLDPLFAPFRALRALVWGVKQAPQSVRGEIARARGQVDLVQSDVKGYRDDLGAAGTGARGAAAKAPPKGTPLPITPKAAKKKMGLFGKKNACESCNKKLHPSWDECPYCGWKKGQPAGAGPPPAAPSAAGSAGGSAAVPRTMALDLGAAGPGVATGMLGWIIPLEGPRLGELIELRGRVTVGKAGDNNVVIEDPSISGHHCELVCSALGWKLNDLGSTNGTYVNDKRVSSHDLIDNDNLKLGKVRFKFKALN